MKPQEWRDMPAAELSARIKGSREEYGALAEAVRQGREKNHARLHQLRADIARGLTVEREMAQKALAQK